MVKFKRCMNMKLARSKNDVKTTLPRKAERNLCGKNHCRRKRSDNNIGRASPLAWRLPWNKPSHANLLRGDAASL